MRPGQAAWARLPIDEIRLDCCRGDGRSDQPPSGAEHSFHTAIQPTTTMMTPNHGVPSDAFDYLDSSPDPLAASFDQDDINRARPAASRTAKQQPLASSSPSKQNRRPLRRADMDLSSPTKQLLLNTPRTAGQSPWRIKVTVQAEPGSDSENAQSPIIQHVTHTKTTTIPLKDHDASSPVKRRGRPKKSDAPTKRSGTPVRRRATSKPRRQSASAAHVEPERTPQKRRGRPPKNRQPVDDDDIWEQARPLSVDAHARNVQADVDPTPKKRRGRPRKSIQPLADDVPIPGTDVSVPQSFTSPSVVDSEHSGDTQLHPAMGEKDQPDQEQAPSPIMEATSSEARPRRTRLNSTPAQTDASRKLNQRKNTPVSKLQDFIEISSDEESDDNSEAGEEVSPSQAHGSKQLVRAADDQGNLESLHVPPQTSEDQDVHDETCFAFDEGATRMPDDTTIIDSENFSMISVDSLPSCASVRRPANGTTCGGTLISSHKAPNRHVDVKIPSTTTQNGDNAGISSRSSPALLCPRLSLDKEAREVAAPSLRYKTPSVEPGELSDPPPVEPPKLSFTEAQTPRIGRVVTAGVALQGVLDPSRVTPEGGSSKVGQSSQGYLDDLFRGFSERTRRELHAGLRLGEQLAKQNDMKQPSSPALSSPTKPADSNRPPENSATTSAAPQQSRLLTPEDQDDNVLSSMQPVHVQYPDLQHNDQDSGLLSPVSNSEGHEDEIERDVETPPAFLADNASTQIHPSRESARGEQLDIWEEEASRASITSTGGNALSHTPQIQGSLTQDVPISPVHGSVPKTYQRDSSDNFDYNRRIDESHTSATASESGKPDAKMANKRQSKMERPPRASEFEEDGSDEDDGDSDDTGMFFQANVPSLYDRQRSSEFPRRRRARKQEEILLDLDESLLPESSPATNTKTPVADKANPFMDTPPQLLASRSSPLKSSPLRQELRGSDISSDSVHQTFEESTLPLAPSSPFHTYVDGDTGLSMASDQRQLLRETAGIDSSLHRIRDEADEYLQAYEPQDRTLQDLTEVTEPSRTWYKDPTMLTSSPLRRAPYEPRPIVANAEKKEAASVASQAGGLSGAQRHTNMPDANTSTHSTARTGKETAHPALAKLDPLPRIEPWTKTHYKALDRLYQLYKKQPSIFSTSASTNTTLNAELLTSFLNTTTRDFIGARYRAWGYNVIFTEALIVLCAAFMQLLTLNSIEEYEEKAGKQIHIGDCAPSATGNIIGPETVVERLATIVLGEAVRRDEKAGKVVDKSGRLRVEWP